jgi:hypothetical protein
MRRWLRLAAAAAAIGGSTSATAATVSVTITGVSEVGYELTVAGVRKTGWLAASPGPSSVRAQLDVAGQSAVTATVTFLGSAGVLATCPAVEVKLENEQAACEPAFVLSGRQAGLQRFECQSRCDPRREGQKSSGEDDDEEEWVYAMRQPRPAPRLDGWAAARPGVNPATQSFYTDSMSSGGFARLYSSTVGR